MPAAGSSTVAFMLAVLVVRYCCRCCQLLLLHFEAMKQSFEQFVHENYLQFLKKQQCAKAWLTSEF
jgi:hypothetical protein